MLVLKKVFTTIFCCFLVGSTLLFSQNKATGVLSTTTTAVPFLRINPDARAGGMGDVGIATPADANGLYANPSKMAFVPDDYGFAMSFSPWLKALVNDIYLASLNGYYKVKKEQVISASLRYFSLGNIQFTDQNGMNTSQFMPREFAVDVSYARKLGDYFSIAASLRYIYSNLATGQQVGGSEVRPGQAGAGDISWYFHKVYGEDKPIQNEFSCGMNISNIGSKMSYTSSVTKDFIPTNLGIGLGYTAYLDKHNSVGLYMDINKLLVPTPYDTAKNSQGIYLWRTESSIKGMFTSFSDAPSSVIIKTFDLAWGAEYFYDKRFGVRFGYFYEPYENGGRQFLEAGLTIKYSVVGLHFSYLIPTTILRNPLDNTLRFSLLFNFNKGGKKSGENNSGISFVDDTPKKAKTDTKTPPLAQPQTAPVLTPAPAPATTPAPATPDNNTPVTPK
jgi:hypothetical protein